MRRLIAIAALAVAGCGDSEPKDTDFKAFSAAAATARSGALGECELVNTHARDGGLQKNKAGIIRCMEGKGYSHDPR